MKHVARLPRAMAPSFGEGTSSRGCLQDAIDGSVCTITTLPDDLSVGKPGIRASQEKAPSLNPQGFRIDHLPIQWKDAIPIMGMIRRGGRRGEDCSSPHPASPPSES